MANKNLQTAAIVLAGLGALNWGLSEFVNIDILSYVPAGMIKQIAIGAIGISGALVLFWKFKKQM